jgi:hypothetical protein
MAKKFERRHIAIEREHVPSVAKKRSGRRAPDA